MLYSKINTLNYMCILLESEKEYNKFSFHFKFHINTKKINPLGHWGITRELLKITTETQILHSGIDKSKS